MAAVRSELDAIQRRLAEAYPVTNREPRFAVVRTLDQIVGDDALGKRIVNAPGRQVLTVVGIVPDFKHRRLNEDPVPQLY